MIRPGRAPIPVQIDGSGANSPSRLHREVPVDDGLLARLHGVCAAVDTSPQARIDAGRDWWPLALAWAVEGTVPARPAAVARPSTAAEVAAVLTVCAGSGVPVTAVAGRSGVCGASIPAFGGVSLDLTGLAGIVGVDGTSALVDVRGWHLWRRP